MSAQRVVEFTCDVTGIVLRVADGDEYGEMNQHGYTPKVTLYGPYSMRDAVRAAYAAGWRSHSLRDIDGFFRTYVSVPSSGRAAYYGDYWTAPGVNADPPLSKTAELARGRREAFVARQDEVQLRIMQLEAQLEALRGLPVAEAGGAS